MTAKPAAEAEMSASTEPGSADVFAGIHAYLADNPELASQVQTVFQFELSDPPSRWVLDLKNGSGSCTEGAAENPDVTLSLADADFLAMCTGKADPNKLYFGGKLKISGNIMASQKLGFLQKMDPKYVSEAAAARGGAAPATAGPEATAQPAENAPAAPAREPQAPAFFAALEARITESPDLLGGLKGQAVVFHLSDTGESWLLDAREAAPQLAPGDSEEAAARFTLSDSDLVALAEGAAEVRALYQQGRLRVDGDVRLARELGFLREAAEAATA